MSSCDFVPCSFFPKILQAPFSFCLNRKGALFSFWDFLPTSKMVQTNFGCSTMYQGDQNILCYIFSPFLSLSFLFDCFAIFNGRGALASPFLLSAGLAQLGLFSPEAHPRSK